MYCVNHSHGLWLIMINHKFKILGFTCKCVEKEIAWQTSLRKQNLSHFHQVWDIILIILLSLFICFYSAIISLYTGNKNVYQATSLQSHNTFTQLLSKVFLNKYNKTFSCDLTWNIMTKCIMKKNWTCSGALELTLASCFIRQFMRLIVHFYSELTSNHHRVFVITSFCDHMWNLVVYCC